MQEGNNTHRKEVEEVDWMRRVVFRYGCYICSCVWSWFNIAAHPPGLTVCL